MVIRDTAKAVRARVDRAVREIAIVLVAVLLLGLLAGATTSPDQQSADATSVATAHDQRPPTGQGRRLSTGPLEGTSLASPHQAQADRAAQLESQPAGADPPADTPLPPPPPHRDRWLPSGTGMWLHEWEKSEQGHAHEVVARAKATGLTHLYVQTGSSKKGWIGEQVLSQLMPALGDSGLDVIAWDFPKLDEPEADARRLARAALWQRPGAPRIAAVAPDVETAAEGTNIGAEQVRRYYSTLRAALPADIPILATVPWPSEKRIRKYPYAATAPYADAFVPMAYWYNRSPTVVTATSMEYLARFGLPVMPVGQGYDGRLDAPYLAEDPAPDKSVEAFSFAARSRGARSISLWSWQTTGPLQWQVISDARQHFGAPIAPPVQVPFAPITVPPVTVPIPPPPLVDLPAPPG